MKMYKTFDSDLTRNDFQFEEGKTYTANEANVPVFFACEDPLDCFTFFASHTDIIHEVELASIKNKELLAPTAYSSSVITIGKKMTTEDIYKAHDEYIKKHYVSSKNKLITKLTTKLGNVASGPNSCISTDSSKSAAAGGNSSVTVGEDGTAAAGNGSCAFTGDKGSVSVSNNGCAIAKNYGVSAAGKYSVSCAGDEGVAAVGYSGHSSAGKKGTAAAGKGGYATVGDGGSAVANMFGNTWAGNNGICAAGEYGTAFAGDYSYATVREYGKAAAGKQGVAVAGECGEASVDEHGMACCCNGKARGNIGAVLILVEKNCDGHNVSCACAIVDGVEIKANTWYKCKKGKLVEA